ncbi:MAG: alpha/beta-hydrolase N-terminal domain-containing protein, partial [Candidatus Nanopelagicales bacterium]
MEETTAGAVAHARTQGAGAATSFFRRLLPAYCDAGMLLGALFVFASLTPSLIPRAAPAQAALSGACFAIGYGLGVLLRWLWRYLEVPVPRFARHSRRGQLVLLLCAVIVVLGLWWGQDWDGVLRKLMGISPSSPVRILVVSLGALLAGTLFIVLGRGTWLLLRAGGRLAQRALPRRVAKVLGVIATGVLLVTLLNGVIVRSILNGLDASFAARDSLIAPE